MPATGIQISDGDLIVKRYFAINWLKILNFGRRKPVFARLRPDKPVFPSVVFLKVSLCGVIRVSDVTCPPKNPNRRRIIGTGSRLLVTCLSAMHRQVCGKNIDGRGPPEAGKHWQRAEACA